VSDLSCSFGLVPVTCCQGKPERAANQLQTGKWPQTVQITHTAKRKEVSRLLWYIFCTILH